MFIRLAIGLLWFTAAICFGMSIATGKPEWRARAFLIFKWSVFAAIGYFGILALERLALLL